MLIKKKQVPAPGPQRFQELKRGTKQARYQNATIVISTSPAKIFPKRRKAKERTRDISDKISRNPRKNLWGWISLYIFEYDL